MADVLLISGCKDSQTSADVGNAGQAFGLQALVGGPGGALTNAFMTTITKQPQLNYQQLITGMRVLHWSSLVQA